MRPTHAGSTPGNEPSQRKSKLSLIEAGPVDPLQATRRQMNRGGAIVRHPSGKSGPTGPAMSGAVPVDQRDFGFNGRFQSFFQKLICTIVIKYLFGSDTRFSTVSQPAGNLK